MSFADEVLLAALIAAAATDDLDMTAEDIMADAGCHETEATEYGEQYDTAAKVFDDVME